MSRLKTVNYGDGQTQSYAFDAMGNRSSRTDSVAGTDNYTFDNANRLLARASNTYTNDLNGNTLTGGGRTNTWDSQNRLVQCVNGATTSTYKYGADGLRRQMTSSGTTTDYAMDGSSVVRELRAGVTYATYFPGIRGPEYRRDASNNVRWYLYDGLGSVQGEVDPSGNVTASRKFDVYGLVRGSTGTSTSRHKFMGGLGHTSEDESGLVYMRARYYDPQVGRFASEDSDLQGSNWYLYCANDPINRGDSTGKGWISDTQIAVLSGMLRMLGGQLSPDDIWDLRFGSASRAKAVLEYIRFVYAGEGDDLIAANRADELEAGRAYGRANRQDEDDLEKADAIRSYRQADSAVRRIIARSVLKKEIDLLIEML